MKINNTDLHDDDLKRMLELMAGHIVEAQSQHPSLTDDTQLTLRVKDGSTVYYLCTIEGFKAMIMFILASMAPRTRIDEKHHIEFNRIFKTTNHTPIPDDEPRILFRGRDNLALPMLRFYRQLCVDAGCNDFQLNSIDKMITEFEAFAEQSPTMKQPGITRGK